jgi:pilus assembly protein Flp/PilA
MRRLLARFVVDERGATAIEYAIIAAGISICIVTIVNGMGSALSTKFSEVSANRGRGRRLTPASLLSRPH